MSALLQTARLGGHVRKQLWWVCMRRDTREYGIIKSDFQSRGELGCKPATHAHNMASRSYRIQSMSLTTMMERKREVLNAYNLSKQDVDNMNGDIMKVLNENVKNPELHKVTSHLFSDQENEQMCLMALPILMAKAVNWQLHKEVSLTPTQRKVIMITDILMVIVLLHDDVIDDAVSRRGKPSVNVLWKQIKPSFAGNVLHGISLVEAGKYLNNELTMTVIQVSLEFHKGQLSQYDSGSADSERFANYMVKTRAKIGLPMSLISKAMVQAVGANYFVMETAMKWTDYVTQTTMILDDVVDLESDIREGVATAPVLFACKKYPQLNKLIKRRFQEPGDVEHALELVHQSEGLKETQILAAKFAEKALRHAQCLSDSPYRKALETMSTYFVDKLKLGEDNTIIDVEKEKVVSDDFF